MCYCKSESFDNDIVLKRQKLNSDRFSTLKFYDEIYLEQALELCDMIFTNNLDKVNFLKQYLKSFKVSKNNNNYKKGPKLTKKI